MSERFVTEKDAEVDRAKKQEEWDRVRKSTDPLEAPDAKQEPGDARPLFEKLQDNRMKEQEAIFAQRAFKNQIRGLNEDETAYLSNLRHRDHKVSKVRKVEEDLIIGELKRNQSSFGIRHDLRSDKPKDKPKSKSLIETTKRRKQSALLKGAIKRKADSDDDEPVKPKTERIEPVNAELVKRSHVNAKVNEILSKERDAARPAELSGLSLLVNQYSDSDEDGNSDTSNSDEDSDGLEVSDFKQLEKLVKFSHRPAQKQH